MSTTIPESAADAGRIEFKSLRAANAARQIAWCQGGDPVPDLSFRGVELAGETGEVCNVIKKLERERHGWRGSRDTVEHLSEELADVVICADLAALSAGIDLDAAVIAKFNATSEKVGLPHRLRAAALADKPAPPGAERYRHKKRGTTVTIIGEATVQASTGMIGEGNVVTVYREERHGRLWARDRREFHDGRFEALPSPDAQPAQTCGDARPELEDERLVDAFGRASYAHRMRGVHASGREEKQARTALLTHMAALRAEIARLVPQDARAELADAEVECIMAMSDEEIEREMTRADLAKFRVWKHGVLNLARAVKAEQELARLRSFIPKAGPETFFAEHRRLRAKIDNDLHAAIEQVGVDHPVRELLSTIHGDVHDLAWSLGQQEEAISSALNASPDGPSKQPAALRATATPSRPVEVPGEVMAKAIFEAETKYRIYTWEEWVERCKKHALSGLVKDRIDFAARVAKILATQDAAQPVSGQDGETRS